MKRYDVSTHAHQELVDVTDRVRRAVQESGVSEGICVVFVPHTTAGVTINENADPDVGRDLLTALERAVPWKGDYRHGEGNSAAHVRASLVGSSCHVIVSGGDLELGTWQGIYFAEFDGPRRRQLWVQVLERAS
ncbi:YjbQ family protein [bacterium]|nr:YjbQ family protein [bacterium]